MWRWPSWAGLNDPPSSPTVVARRSPNRGRGSGTHLAVSSDRVAVDGQLLQSDRASRVNTSGGDADLRAEAELAAITELRGRIPERDRAVDTCQEPLRDGGILGDDRIGVRAAMTG